MMMLVGIVVVLLVILLIALCAAVFSETPWDGGDVFCFLAMLALSVVVVFWFFVVKGF